MIFLVNQRAMFEEDVPVTVELWWRPGG